MDGEELDQTSTSIAFLDEFRMIVSAAADYTGTFHELVLFNTLIPQDDPKSSRYVRPPPMYDDWVHLVHTFYNTSWGVLNQYGPLIVDPTQEIHVVKFYCEESRRRVILAFRTQALIEQACSLSTDTDILWDPDVRWDGWGKSSVALEIPDDVLYILVQGLHVITVEVCVIPGSDRESLRFRTFDFSLWACGALSNVGDGGGFMWATWDGDGREVFLEGSENLDSSEFDSLGNGIFFHPVSHICNRKTHVG